MSAHHIFQRGVLAMSAALLIALMLSLLLGWPYAPELLAERMMEVTPSEWAVPLLLLLGVLAKPWAVAGGVAAIALFGGLAALAHRRIHPRIAATIVVAPALLLLTALVSPRAASALVLPALIYAALVHLLSTPRAVPQTAMTRRAFLADSLRGTVAVGGLALLSGAPIVWRALNDRATQTLFAFVPAAPRSPEFARIVRLTPEVTSVANFYVMSKTAQDPRIWRETWQLQVVGQVQRALTLDWRALLALARVDQYTTLQCVSNPVGGPLMSNGFWSGVPLRDLLERAGLLASAQSVAFHALDSFADSLPLASALAPDTLVAYALNGELLNAAHGAPARLVVANRYGFKQVKWLTRIEVHESPFRGRWQELGWSQDAIVKTTARIDTLQRAADGWLAAGVAFAGGRGISRVQVRVDDDAWHDAELHTPPLSANTWVQWRALVPANAPRRVTVRAWDGDGEPQSETPSNAFPDGASGLHSLAVEG